MFNNLLLIVCQIEWYNDEYPTFDECTKFTYTKTSRNAFNMTLDLKNSIDNFAPEEYKGTGIVSKPGMLSTTFDVGPPTRVNHQILATDYWKYAFVWDCENVNATHYNERMWYYDRKPNPHGRPKKVQTLIEKYFDEQYIRKTYQGERCGWCSKSKNFLFGLL